MYLLSQTEPLATSVESNCTRGRVDARQCRPLHDRQIREALGTGDPTAALGSQPTSSISLVRTRAEG